MRTQYSIKRQHVPAVDVDGVCVVPPSALASVAVACYAGNFLGSGGVVSGGSVAAQRVCAKCVNPVSSACSDVCGKWRGGSHTGCRVHTVELLADVIKQTHPVSGPLAMGGYLRNAPNFVESVDDVSDCVKELNYGGIKMQLRGFVEVCMEFGQRCCPRRFSA